MFLLPDCPGKAIRLPAGIDMAGYFQGLQIDNCHCIVRTAGNIRACAVGLHQDTDCSPPELQALDCLVCGGIEYRQIAASE